jgi:hypothetical protein
MLLDHIEPYNRGLHWRPPPFQSHFAFRYLNLTLPILQRRWPTKPRFHTDIEHKVARLATRLFLKSFLHFDGSTSSEVYQRRSTTPFYHSLSFFISLRELLVIEKLSCVDMALYLHHHTAQEILLDCGALEPPYMSRVEMSMCLMRSCD